MSDYKTAIIIPDQHVNQNSCLDRFTALGNFIVERQPDWILNMGDVGEWSDFYGNQNRKTKLDNTDYLENEILAIRKSQELIFTPAIKLQKKQKNGRKKVYRYLSELDLGNHDIRLQKALADNVSSGTIPAHIDKHLPWHACHFNKYYSVINPYQTVHERFGIAHSHHFINGTSSASKVDTIVNIAMGSAIGGHTHKAEFSATYTGQLRPTFGLQAGVFMDPASEPLQDWLGPQGFTNWWFGFVMLHGIDGRGGFEPEFISVERLQREFL